MVPGVDARTDRQVGTGDVWPRGSGDVPEQAAERVAQREPPFIPAPPREQEVIVLDDALAVTADGTRSGVEAVLGRE